ncbi:MAG: SDR family oxidoreductase, partial [Candidatus Freyarchaeota archaeon]
TEASSTYFDRMIELNLKSTFLCCKYISVHMKSVKSGKIINISTIDGKRYSSEYLGFYSAASDYITGQAINVDGGIEPH